MILSHAPAIGAASSGKDLVSVLRILSIFALMTTTAAVPARAEPVAAPRVIAPVTVKVMTFNIWYGGEQVSLPKVAEAIRAADADIVGIDEADGSLARLAELAGYPYVDDRRRILSRYPIFDPGTAERTDTDLPPYSLIGLDRDKLHAWIMIRHGEVVGAAVTHLSSDPSGLEWARQGKSPAEVIRLERELRLPEAVPLTALAQAAANGTPMFLMGDFNAPSHLDWTAEAAAKLTLIPYALEWPVSKALADAGLRDSYREAHPDPVARPGITWTAGQPAPVMPADGMLDRIDFVYAAGKARTIDSRIVGEAGGRDVDIAVTPYPSDHRGVVSTFEVTPAPAPALIAVEPRRVIAGDSFRIRAHDPDRSHWTAVVVRRGDAPTAAITGIYDINALYQSSVTLSTHALPPGDYEALLLDAERAVRKRSAFTVVARDAQPCLAVDRPTVAPGGSIAARWAGSEGNARDWIAIYRVGEPDVSAYSGWAYTQAMFAGVATLTAPKEPGQYELRLMRDESFAVQASAAFEVAADAR